MAARIGVSEDEFWRMLPREFLRRMEAFREKTEREAEMEKHRHFSRMNAAGIAFNGKNWKWLTPKGDVQPVENFAQREARVLQRLAERRQRKAVA